MKFKTVVVALIPAATILWTPLVHSQGDENGLGSPSALKQLRSNVWEQITFPGGGYTSFTDLIGPELPQRDFGNSWIIFRWNPDRELYVRARLTDQPAQGEGVWIIQTYDIDVYVPDNPDAHNLSYVAEPSCNDPQDCVSTDLPDSSGGVAWGMVGNPYATRIKAASLMLQSSDTSSCATGCALAVGSEASIAYSNLFTYDSETETYVVISSSAGGSIDPWTAWWVATNELEDARQVIDTTRGLDTSEPVFELTDVEEYTAPPNVGTDQNARVFRSPDERVRIALVSDSAAEDMKVYASATGSPMRTDSLLGGIAVRFEHSGDDSASGSFFSPGVDGIALECIDETNECSVLPTTSGSDGNEYFTVRDDAFYGVFELGSQD